MTLSAGVISKERRRRSAPPEREEKFLRLLRNPGETGKGAPEPLGVTRGASLGNETMGRKRSTPRWQSERKREAATIIAKGRLDSERKSSAVEKESRSLQRKGGRLAPGV